MAIDCRNFLIGATSIDSIGHSAAARTSCLVLKLGLSTTLFQCCSTQPSTVINLKCVSRTLIANQWSILSLTRCLRLMRAHVLIVRLILGFLGAYYVIDLFRLLLILGLDAFFELSCLSDDFTSLSSVVLAYVILIHLCVDVR